MIERKTRHFVPLGAYKIPFFFFSSVCLLLRIHTHTMIVVESSNKPKFIPKTLNENNSNKNNKKSEISFFLFLLRSNTALLGSAVYTFGYNGPTGMGEREFAEILEKLRDRFRAADSVTNWQLKSYNIHARHPRDVIFSCFFPFFFFLRPSAK